MRVLPLTRAYRLKVVLLRQQGLEVAPTVRWVSTATSLGGRVTVGDGAFIGHSVRFYGGPSSTIAIGSDVDLGPHVVVLAGTHEIDGVSRRAGLGRPTDVTVGNGTWVGGRVTIVGPCNIGPGCVIAAGVILRGVVPANSLYLSAGDVRPIREPSN